jgi:hypothetical protein
MEFTMAIIANQKEAKATTQTRAVAIGGGKTKKDGSPTDYLCVLAEVDSTGAPVEVHEVLKGPHPAVAGLTVERRFPSAAKAERAGFDHWLEAEMDEDAMVAAFKVKLQQGIAPKVENYRKELRHMKAIRKLAKSANIKVEEAAERLKRDAGDDDNVLA